MAEEISFHDGDIVWVKMNKLWWPGEVHGTHRLPSDFLEQSKKPPLFVVKFFQEQNYHCVNQLHQIARFNCAKKNEYIKKGLDLYYAKHTYMTEFPADVAIAEKRTGGNPNIIYSKEFLPIVKPDKATPTLAAKGSTSRSRRGQQIQTSTPSIPRVMIKPDHDTRIMVSSAPATSASSSAPTTPTAVDNKYKCTSCNFSTNRINTFVWHQKTHSSPKTPQSSSTTPKYPTKQTPKPTTVTGNETKSSSSTKLFSETEVTSENTVQSKPSADIAEPMDTATESIDKTPEPVTTTGKSKAKRARSSVAKAPKVADKIPKTENKLRKILDDWSDDEVGEAGPSGLISSKKIVKCTASDEDDEEGEEMKKDNKKSKLDSEMSRKSNESEKVDSVSMAEDMSSKTAISITSVDADKTESKPKLAKKNTKDETVTQSTNNVAGDDIKPQTRFSLRSGRNTLANESSPALPKRRGRAKRGARDSLKSESESLEVKESEAKPKVPEKREVIDSVPSGDKISDESVQPAPNQTSSTNKSHSKTSRKGTPRRKEEIKLSNNISVAVLVEKTSSCPSTEQKLDDEFTNVVHKKIRYMGRNSTDDHRKSIESIEAPKSPALPNETTKWEPSDRMIVDPENLPEDDTANRTVHSNDQKEDNNAETSNVSVVSDLSETNGANSEKKEEVEKVTENLIATQSPHEQRVVQKCYERKVSPKKALSLDQPESCTTAASFFADDTNVDSFESTSSSNLRHRSPKRYENTRNRRKSDRRTLSDDDFTAITKTIDDNCEENERAIRKSVELNNSLDEGNTKLPDVINGKVDMSENSNSKTSTPEKADSSKELDCFDFTEDECLKPPQVLNRRKRPPPAKVYELDDIDKIEEERKIDEEATRVAQQREEENQKLHAELENLLNSTTPATLPEIPIGPKEQENFPERGAEKDPEKIAVKDGDVKDRMLPPKERNKRIFKYRNRNRRPDVDVKVASDSEERKGNDASDSFQLSDGNTDDNVVTSEDKIVDDLKLQSNDHVPETDGSKDTPSAHDLKIEIAKALINFPLLSPHTDVSKEPIAKVVATRQPATKRKESGKNTKNAKKIRATVLVESIPEVMGADPTTATMEEVMGSATKQHSSVDDKTNSEAVVLHSKEEIATTILPLKATDKTIMETHTSTANPDTNPAASSSVRNFSRIRLIEKIENHSPVQLNDETPQSKTNQLPLTNTVTLTQTESSSLITRIPKKRKSQMDDDIPPAFVIERPKDNPDDASELHSVHNLAKKQPKSFIVTKTAKKQVTGELLKQSTVNAAVGVHPNSSGVSEVIHFHHGTKSNATKSVDTPVPNPVITPTIEAPERSAAMETPVIVSSQLIKPTPTINTQQKRTVATTSTVTANILGSLSANRPCTIAPAKKATYRKPADMTGLTQKQIGIDGKGNPVMVYTKITPIAAQSPPAMAQATFTLKNNETNPSTSQVVQSSNPGNQFVITSKGKLITNKPFITTTHSTLHNQPTLTKRPNIIHTQLICSPNSPIFQSKQHPSPQSSQILTKPPNSLPQISSVAPIGNKQPTNRRSVGNKANLTAARPSKDTTATTPALKKRVVRRTSKNQPSTAATQQMQPNQQQQVILNSEINYVGSAPVPPLIPLNDQPAPMTSRQQPTKQRPTQMTFIPEIPEPQAQSKVTHTEVVDQQQENILALPGDTPGFGGPPGSYFLCKLNEMGMYVPIDNQPLYLDVTDNTNLLKPNAPAELQALTTEIRQESPVHLNEVERVVATNQTIISDQDVNSPKYLINISDGQQLLVDQQGLMALTNGEEFPQFVTSDGHQIILQSGQNDILSAIAFAEDVGLIAGQQILIPEDDLAVIQGQGGNQDILAAALAGTEGFSQEQFIDNGVEGIVVDPMVYHAMTQPAIQPLTNAVTNETNAVLTQPPIMSTLEQPTKTDRLSPNHSRELCSQNLDESLAVIGVTASHTNVPTSLELPITITNPAIAPKSASTMATIYPPTVAAEHDLDYDIFSSSSPITHHLTQPINENYRTVNVINSIGDIDMDSNIVAVAAASHDQFTGRN